MDAMIADFLENSDSTDSIYSVDAHGSECVAPEKVQTSNKIRKVYKQIRPKVNTEWSHNDIIKLITAVEERPTLWDISSPQYKLPKTPTWQEIADAIEERTADECKAKWSNLRVTFKTNLSKSKRQKSGSAAGGNIVWKYFNSMMFLEVNETSQTSESISSMAVPVENSNWSVTECEPTLPKRTRKIPSVSPMPLSQSSPSSNCDIFKEMAAKAICTIAEKTDTKDQFDAFGAFVAAELRSLPLQKGMLAKRKLNRALMDIMDDAENSV